MGRGRPRGRAQGEPLRTDAVWLQVNSGPHCYPHIRVGGMAGSMLPCGTIHTMKEHVLEPPGMFQVREGGVTYHGQILV